MIKLKPRIRKIRSIETIKREAMPAIFRPEITMSFCPHCNQRLPVSHWVNLLQDEKDFYQDTVNLILAAIGPKAILEYLRKQIT